MRVCSFLDYYLLMTLTRPKTFVRNTSLSNCLGESRSAGGDGKGHRGKGEEKTKHIQSLQPHTSR